jgi:hypothetical protein
MPHPRLDGIWLNIGVCTVPGMHFPEWWARSKDGETVLTDGWARWDYVTRTGFQEIASVGQPGS